MRNTIRFALAGVVLIAALGAPRAATPIRVMLLDGANNHDWGSTTPIVHKATVGGSRAITAP